MEIATHKHSKVLLTVFEATVLVVECQKG